MFDIYVIKDTLRARSHVSFERNKQMNKVSFWNFLSKINGRLKWRWILKRWNILNKVKQKWKFFKETAFYLNNYIFQNYKCSKLKLLMFNYSYTLGDQKWDIHSNNDLVHL